jgi:hypothetical protein
MTPESIFLKFKTPILALEQMAECPMILTFRIWTWEYSEE